MSSYLILIMLIVIYNVCMFIEEYLFTRLLYFESIKQNIFHNSRQNGID